MKPKRSRTKRTKRYFGLRLHPGWSVKKGTRFITKLVRFTGIPAAYSDTAAWFAERLILAGVCIAVTSFAAGIIFSLYLSGPIANSQTYAVIATKARGATEQIIDLTSPIFDKLLSDNRSEDKLKAAALAQRKYQIQQYLMAKGSPFAVDDGALTALAEARNMKLILAISFVESNFGKHCYYYNCSGIGGSVPNLRKYGSYAEWIRDFDQLLEDRYKGLPPEKFLGLYVQPGSPNWLAGVKQVLNEFKQLGLS